MSGLQAGLAGAPSPPGTPHDLGVGWVAWGSFVLEWKWLWEETRVPCVCGPAGQDWAAPAGVPAEPGWGWGGQESRPLPSAQCPTPEGRT